MARADTGQVRIIGGRWRGRRLPVSSQPGLRPTGSRIRETLFNWLAPIIDGSCCLDCFAGSGALGLEAASRGAREVVMLEQSPQVVRDLQANLARLQSSEVRLVRADALSWLAGSRARRFDICFLDPPFSTGLLDAAIERLAQGDWLAAGARVYLELDPAQPFPALPPGWKLIRDKRAGQVRYALATVLNDHADTA